MLNHRLFGMFGISSIVFLLLLSTVVRADYEAVAHGVKYYGASGECSGDNVYWNDAYLKEWDDAFEDVHDYDTSRRWKNKEVDGIDFSSSDHVYPYGTDWADAIMFHGHGGRKCSGGYYTWIKMGEYGENSDSCYQYITSDLIFGEGGPGEDGNGFVSISCKGAHLCVWKKGGFNSMRGGSQFNTFNSYHGIHKSTQWDARRRFENYLECSRKNNIGEEWVKEMTVEHIIMKNCAVHITWAASESDADDHCYWSGWRDFHSTGWGHTYYYFINNCDPRDGEKLKK